MTWHRVGRLDDLVAGQVEVVHLPRDARGIPREAIVLRLPASKEPSAESDAPAEPVSLRAFLNRCAHIPIPLDGGSREFFARGPEYLACGTHGALYRLEDGFCVGGPCRGRSLERLELKVEPGGTVWVAEPEEG